MRARFWLLAAGCRLPAAGSPLPAACSPRALLPSRSPQGVPVTVAPERGKLECATLPARLARGSPPLAWPGVCASRWRAGANSKGRFAASVRARRPGTKSRPFERAKPTPPSERASKQTNGWASAKVPYGRPTGPRSSARPTGPLSIELYHPKLSLAGQIEWPTK